MDLSGLQDFVNQSSTANNGNPELAIDGNTDGDYYGGSCTHTDNYNPWWEIDLQGTYNITALKLYNRLDCCGKIVSQ